MAAKKPVASAAATISPATDLAHARAHWQRRQGLDAPRRGALADVVASTGWLRTLGGVDVYLALRARVPSLVRADLGGLWEYDPAKRDVDVAFLGKASPKLRQSVQAAAKDVGRFLREEMGHGKSFSLDTDASLAERAAYVRTLA